jgi:hypothetical protein
LYRPFVIYRISEKVAKFYYNRPAVRSNPWKKKYDGERRVVKMLGWPDIFQKNYWIRFFFNLINKIQMTKNKLSIEIKSQKKITFSVY